MVATAESAAQGLPEPQVQIALLESATAEATEQGRAAMIVRGMLVSQLCFAVHLCGCAMWQGNRVPNLVASSQEVAVDPVPRILVVVGHRHTMEGDRREWAEGISKKVFVESYERTSQQSAVMRGASVTPTEPVNYILFLDTAVDEHGQLAAFFSGLTLMVFPVVLSSDVIVTGSLYEAASGTEVGFYEAKGEINTLVWLLLLPATPITLALAPGRELYDQTFQDLFIQLAAQLQNRPPPDPVDPTRIDVQRVPEHVKRDIRIRPEEPQ